MIFGGRVEKSKIPGEHGMWLVSFADLRKDAVFYSRWRAILYAITGHMPLYLWKRGYGAPIRKDGFQ